MSGSGWNPDRLRITLESIPRSKLGVLESQDPQKVNDSTLWQPVTGMMPSDPLAVYVPLFKQLHEIRMVVNDEAMRGFQDYTAHLRVQYLSEDHPLPVLPEWVSYIAILLPGGKEIPLPDGYTVHTEKLFYSMTQQTAHKGKSSLPDAFNQFRRQCVRILLSPPSSTYYLMRRNRLRSTRGRSNIICPRSRSVIPRFV